MATYGVPQDRQFAERFGVNRTMGKELDRLVEAVGAQLYGVEMTVAEARGATWVLKHLRWIAEEARRP
jgi:hypothetical protein